MHERLHQSRCQLHVVDLVVISGIQRRWSQQGGGPLHLHVARVGWVFSSHSPSSLFIFSPWRVVDGAFRFDSADETILVLGRRHVARKLNVFEAISATFLVLTEELTELSTAIRSKAIKMAPFSESQRVRFTTRNCNYFFIRQASNFGRERLIGFLISVLQKFRGVIETQLAIGCFSPGINNTFSGESHGVRVTTSQLHYELVLEAVNSFGNWHEGTRVHIERHC